MNYHDRGIFHWVLKRTLLFLTSGTVFDLKCIIKISFDGLIEMKKDSHIKLTHFFMSTDIPGQ